MKDGIGIHLSQMNNISIVDNGQAVLIEGGVLNGDLVTHLWARGKQTATTGCDCVGFIAPILGGGHGYNQGRYGKATDQLLSARLVLANGTAIDISQEYNPDLFWAIRGAGHNFGIVTRAKLRIYDVEPDQQQWAASGFVLTHDKLEALYAIANSWVKDPNKPIGFTNYFVFAFNPEIDGEHVSQHYRGSSRSIVLSISSPSSSHGFTIKGLQYPSSSQIRCSRSRRWLSNQASPILLVPTLT